MSLISALLTSSAEAPPTGRTSWGGSSFGQMLGLEDPREAWMRQATAWACVTLISDSCALLPKRIVRREDRSRREVREPRFRALWHKPNPDSLPMTFWGAIFVSLTVRGKAFAWRDGQNLWFLHPNRVKVGPDANGRKVFVLDDTRPLTSREIVHFVGQSDNGLDGISTVDVGRRTLDSALTADAYAAKAVGRGKVPAGVITSEQVLEQTAVEQIKANWNENYGRPEQAGDIAVFGKGAKFEAINFTPEQLQLLGSRLYNRDEVPQLWRVMPHLIGLTDKPSAWGTGIEALSIAFVRYTLMHWIVRAEQVVTYDLLPDEMQYKFVVQALERADLAARIEAYRKSREAGVLSADEWRESEDMAPRQGVPDDYLLPANMQRLSPQTAGALSAQPAIAAIAGAIRDWELTERIGSPVYAQIPPPAIEADFEDITGTQQLAQAFLGGRSYGQLAIQFNVDGKNPSETVKKRLTRHFDGSPAEARRLHLSNLAN